MGHRFSDLVKGQTERRSWWSLRPWSCLLLLEFLGLLLLCLLDMLGGRVFSYCPGPKVPETPGCWLAFR